MRIFLACLATFLKNRKMLRLIQFLIVVKTLFNMEKKHEIYLNGQRSTYEILLSYYFRFRSYPLEYLQFTTSYGKTSSSLSFVVAIFSNPKNSK